MLTAHCTGDTGARQMVQSVQWLNYSKVGGGKLHFLSSLSLPSPLLPALRSRPLKFS